MVISIYLTILSFTFIPLSRNERFGELFGISAASGWLLFYVAFIEFSFEVGLTLTVAQSMLGRLQFGILRLSETEIHLTSIERLLEYAKLDPEPSLGTR